ncbi:hypothetical protein HJG60_009131 [Phyllostomus discolor]|uniref:Uncharacterized protein n=1 Tax=Phyllostomus discolor TaxID=89673 RepID=A0A833YFL1_9CHIR|nr:hypothetical protein HJG60_009131 [Phyllostomus discolor]
MDCSESHSGNAYAEPFPDTSFLKLKQIKQNKKSQSKEITFFQESPSSRDWMVGTVPRPCFLPLQAPCLPTPSYRWVPWTQAEARPTFETPPASSGFGVCVLPLGEQSSLGMQRSGERRVWLHWQCQRALGGFHGLVSLAFEDDPLLLQLLKAVLTGTSPSAFPKTFLHKPSFPLVAEAVSCSYAFPPCGRGRSSHRMSPFPRRPAWGPLTFPCPP